MIERAISDWPLADLEHLFIENVGNLVCPAIYDLGEHTVEARRRISAGETER